MNWALVTFSFGYNILSRLEKLTLVSFSVIEGTLKHLPMTTELKVEFKLRCEHPYSTVYVFYSLRKEHLAFPKCEGNRHNCALANAPNGHAKADETHKPREIRRSSPSIWKCCTKQSSL